MEENKVCNEGKKKVEINNNKTSMGGMECGGGEEDLASTKPIQNLDIQNPKTELKQELIDFKKFD